MRTTRVLLVLVLLAACRDDDVASEQQRQGPDPSLLTKSSGEVSLSDGGSLSYVITSERYRKWDAAQSALSKSVARHYGQLLNPRAPSERSINRAVVFLERAPASRAAIERAGLSVRDFVVMTVALEQQMQLASSSGVAPGYPPGAPVDSGYMVAPPATAAPTYAPPYPAYPPAYSPPQPAYSAPATAPSLPAPTYSVPTPAEPVTAPAPTLPPPQMNPRRADTVPTRTVFPAAPRDTQLRRDSVPVRDSLARRDTIVPPRRTDTLTTASPPDTLPLR